MESATHDPLSLFKTLKTTVIHFFDIIGKRKGNFSAITGLLGLPTNWHICTAFGEICLLSKTWSCLAQAIEKLQKFLSKGTIKNNGRASAIDYINWTIRCSNDRNWIKPEFSNSSTCPPRSSLDFDWHTSKDCYIFITLPLLQGGSDQCPPRNSR